MKYAPRLYSCVLCHAQAVICTYCDRGQIYCTKNCSKQASLKSCRKANARYQQTSKGRRLHAARQKLYRLRQLKKVTDLVPSQVPSMVYSRRLKIRQKMPI